MIQCINFFSNLKPAARAKALNYAVTVVSVQRSWLNGEYYAGNMSAINTSFSKPIRHCQEEWVQAPLTRAAKQHIQQHLGLQVDFATYGVRQSLNKQLKAVGVETLYWEHITDLQSVNDELLSMKNCIASAEEMIQFLADRTLIVLKLTKTESGLNHKTPIVEVEKSM
jgi:hypothetical protein